MSSLPIAGQILSFAERSHARAMALLAILCIVVFAPGFMGLPPMDRDEPRFAQATKQMLESGDFVDIRFQTEARHKKPVGIYWMQAAVVGVAEEMGISEARRTIWLYRIPSLLGAILTVLLTYAAAVGLTTRRAAFMAGALMAGVILLGVEARLAKTDAVVAATVVIGMAALARSWTNRLDSTFRLSWGWAIAFWVAMGVGILVKGPITPAVPLLAAIILAIADRSAGWLRQLRPLVGLLIVIAIVAPWFVAITLKSGGTFFSEAVGQDMLAKVGSGQEAHGAPPGTYLAVFAGTAWPLAPFLLLALPFAWRTRRDAAVLFCIAWALPMWIVFELVPTKLPHYVLPLYPALAILVAIAAEKQALARTGTRAKADHGTSTPSRSGSRGCGRVRSHVSRRSDPIPRDFGADRRFRPRLDRVAHLFRRYVRHFGAGGGRSLGSAGLGRICFCRALAALRRDQPEAGSHRWRRALPAHSLCDCRLSRA